MVGGKVKVVGAPGYDEFEAEYIGKVRLLDGREMTFVRDRIYEELQIIESKYVYPMENR